MMQLWIIHSIFFFNKGDRKDKIPAGQYIIDFLKDSRIKGRNIHTEILWKPSVRVKKDTGHGSRRSFWANPQALNQLIFQISISRGPRISAVAKSLRIHPIPITHSIIMRDLDIYITGDIFLLHDTEAR